MPTLLIWRGHKFRFYSSDGPEPPHIHVIKDAKTAKVWLNGLEVAYRRGYTDQELQAVNGCDRGQSRHLDRSME